MATPKKLKPKQPALTTKQEAFALEYLLNGKIAIDAYKEVYDVKPDASKGNLYVEAHRVLKNPKVSLRVHQLEMAEYSDQILSIEERKQLLTKWSKEGDIKAVDLLNKMDSVYTEKIVADVTTQNTNTVVHVIEDKHNDQDS